MVRAFIECVSPLDHVANSLIVVLKSLWLNHADRHVDYLLLGIASQFLKIFVSFLKNQASSLQLGLEGSCVGVKEECIFNAFQCFVKAELNQLLRGRIISLKVSAFDLLIFEVVSIVQVDEFPILIHIEIFRQSFPSLADSH